MSLSRGSPTPVIIEMAPSSAAAATSAATATTSTSPSSPKAVRFASSASGLVRSTREANSTEAWAAYKFEEHSSRCVRCTESVNTHLRNAPLCEDGRHLARAVEAHLRHDCTDGRLYSTHPDAAAQPERIELHREYTRVRDLLKGLAYDRRRQQRRSTVITYDDSAPPPSLSARRSTAPSAASAREGIPSSALPSSPDTYRRHSAVILEPSISYRDSDRDRTTSAPTPPTSASSRSRHRSTRYPTTVVRDDVEADLARLSLNAKIFAPSSANQTAPSIAAATAGSSAPPSPSRSTATTAAASGSTSSSRSKPADRRGSLYEDDTRRVQRAKAYPVEERESHSHRHHHRRRGDRYT